ncbi:hypothetical protein [Clostridium folliculivorans]|uniref:hypothetical protein n=1 Tax=Clostridium folliculivorans TaxID=2886038 RepID=UPI0021C45112|nr:hypothetical protein [Clostridium folliculivorans]GKU30433.1 hypothetical protein CFB3_25400 [Clostridium folliculivorans]
MNSYSENIKNAFSVVYSTLENVKKLMEYCDKVAEENGYYSCTDRFLRYNTDNSVDGWVYNKFFKIYQSSEGEVLSNGWRNGPLYVLEINLEEEPKYYVSKFEYENIGEWNKGISPSSWWAFYFPTDITDNRIEFRKLDDTYTEGKPRGSYKKSYFGLERTVFRSGDLLEINSDTVNIYIFGEFDKLRDK